MGGLALGLNLNKLRLSGYGRVLLDTPPNQRAFPFRKRSGRKSVQYFSAEACCLLPPECRTVYLDFELGMNDACRAQVRGEA